jgi:seryl-tRNA synthetase
MIDIHIPNDKTINFTIDKVTEKLTFTCYQALKLHLNKLIQYITKEKIQDTTIINKVDGTKRTFYSQSKVIDKTNKQRKKKVLKVRYIPSGMITVQRSDKEIKEEKYLKLIRSYERAIEKGHSINVNEFVESMNRV